MKELGRSNPQAMSVQATAYSQNCEIQILGNITNRQTYDAATGHFEPDYTQRACQMFPKCLLLDPDNPVETETFNSQLTSFQWVEVTSAGQTPIYPTSNGVKDGYDVDKEGEYKGMLYIKGNGKVGVKRTVRFIGKWTDPVSGYVYRFQQDKPLDIEDATDARPVITLDSPSAVTWNPLRQQAEQTIRANVMLGSQDVTSSKKCKIWWVRVLDDGSREQITSGNVSDSWEIKEATTAENGQITSITIDRNLIGDSISYEVYAAYRAEGVLPTEYTSTDAKAITTIVRVIPALEVRYVGTTTSISEGVAKVLCRAIVIDGSGVIDTDTWSEYAKMKWEHVAYTVDKNGNRAENATLIGYGAETTVPVDESKFLRLTLLDRGNFVALIDDDGSYLVDDSGNRIIERELTD